MLYLLYALFLAGSALSALLFIGSKAKTALMSGGSAALLAFLFGWQMLEGQEWAHWAGLILSLGLTGVFAWRTTLTLFKVLELVKTNAAMTEIQPKAIAFLIIGLMAVVSLGTSLTQAYLLLTKV